MSARAAGFRPGVGIGGVNTRVLVEQTAVVDARQRGASVGILSFEVMRRVDAARRPRSMSMHDRGGDRS
jgi:hypothetical protein